MMTLKALLGEKAFHVGLKANSKKDIIKEIAEFFAHVYHLEYDKIFKALWEREEKGSTGLGKELAVPHARVSGLDSMKLAVFYAPDGKDFDAYDQIPTKLFFAAVIDEDAHPQEQLDMLRIIVETCEKTDLMENLSKVHTRDELHDLVIRRITEVQNS